MAVITAVLVVWSRDPRMSQDFDSEALGEAMMRTLGLRSGDKVEILHDRLNPLRIMLVRRTNDMDQSTKSG